MFATWIRLWIVFGCLTGTGGSFSLLAQEPDKAANDKTILVHLMPWYRSKPISGSWGWHWTMNHFDPDQVEKDLPQIASHYHPLIGPYDSGDPRVLDCQLQLMKLAGIQGVIVDWYGTADFRDYAEIHRNTQQLIAAIKRAGLKFAICYEDQAVKHRSAADKLDRDQWMAAAQRDLNWLDQNCFSDSSYVTIKQQPLLLVFGPQFLQARDWEILRNQCQRKPLLTGLPHLTKKANFPGVFGWPPVHGGKVVASRDWQAYLDRLDERTENETVVPIVFPGFRDIYQQAKVGSSYGFIDDEQGKTFQLSLNRAIRSNSPIVQIATWNDYGEGTNIEPTFEYGYRYLQALQKIRKDWPFQPQDLELPVQLYRLRQKVTSKEEQTRLKELSEQLLQGKTDEVRRALDQRR